MYTMVIENKKETCDHNYLIAQKIDQDLQNCKKSCSERKNCKNEAGAKTSSGGQGVGHPGKGVPLPGKWIFDRNAFGFCTRPAAGRPVWRFAPK